MSPMFMVILCLHFIDIIIIDTFICMQNITCNGILKNKGVQIALKTLIPSNGINWGSTLFKDVANELAPELQATPDIIVGNYTEGKLVGSLMAHKLGFTQCIIAHALAKTKYPNSDIYWKKFEDQYHLSCQITTDLIAMNHDDFIITSTFQEISRRYSPQVLWGQYESHMRPKWLITLHPEIDELLFIDVESSEQKKREVKKRS